jgi:hypothetical protein
MAAITMSTAALAVACGDDDSSSSSSSGGVDAGKDTGPVITPDTGPGPDAGTNCTFASFVINLVNTQSNNTALPSADLGEKCTETTSQDEFKPLFP